MSNIDLKDEQAIKDRLLAIIAKEGIVEIDKLTPAATLDSLGVASADVVVILLAIEEEFGVYIPVDAELSDVKTVGDMTAMLTRHILANGKSPT